MITELNLYGGEVYWKFEFFERITSFCEIIMKQNGDNISIITDRPDRQIFRFSILENNNMYVILFIFQIRWDGSQNTIKLHHTKNDTYKKLGNYLFYKISHFTPPQTLSTFEDVKFTKELSDIELDIEEYNIFDDMERFGL